MADDKLFDDDGLENGADKADDDSGLGNLPPLSDFDSHGEGDSGDSGDALPPLGDFEAQGEGEISSPLQEDKEFSPQTPDIGSGNVGGGDDDIGLPAFDSGAFSDTTPDDDESAMSAGGFQDLAADSDFSPETPDIGPGPDSALDTPIFDSAFGGEDSGFSGIDSGYGSQTGATTQAMESPMFDDFGGESDFATPELAATPVPDFSPDTGFTGGAGGGGEELAGAGAAAGAPAMAGAGMGAGGTSSQQAVKKGGANWLVVMVFVVIAFFIGVVNSPFLADYLTFLPNPIRDEVASLERDIASKEALIRQLENATSGPEGQSGVTEERLKEIATQIENKTKELSGIEGQLESTRGVLSDRERDLNNLERELRERNDEIISAREFLEELRNETAIVQARQRGLNAEVDRLTGQVGELEVANQRRVATKDALAHNVDRLVIQVKESIPLAPQGFDYAERLAAAQKLREKVEEAPWVTPELQSEYTSLYLRELELAQSNEYFFANIAVTDRFGHRSLKWAECLMRGNWAVYYRTLDGANIGSFENIGSVEMPQWGFREDMPEEVRQSVEAHIINARIPDFESQAKLLAERELAGQEGSILQRTYSSL